MHIQNYVDAFGITPPPSIFGNAQGIVCVPVDEEPEFPADAGLSGRRLDLATIIYNNVTVEDRGFDTPCYIWQGSNSGTVGKHANYPKMSLDGQTVRVHRVIYTIFAGFIHMKRHVDHKCRSRMCVRFEHLQAVTPKMNFRLRDEANGVVRKKRRRRRRKPALSA